MSAFFESTLYLCVCMRRQCLWRIVALTVRALRCWSNVLLVCAALSLWRIVALTFAALELTLYLYYIICGIESVAYRCVDLRHFSVNGMSLLCHSPPVSVAYCCVYIVDTELIVYRFSAMRRKCLWHIVALTVPH